MALAPPGLQAMCKATRSSEPSDFLEMAGGQLVSGLMPPIAANKDFRRANDGRSGGQSYR